MVAAICLPLLAACGGGKTAAQKTADAAVQAKAACQVFANFHPPAGTGAAQQTRYAQASAQAFHQAADLARAAAREDSRWAVLASAATREASAFDVIVSAATVGVTTGAAQQRAYAAVKTAKAARPVFIAECAKADPARFQPVPSASPTEKSQVRPAVFGIAELAEVSAVVVEHATGELTVIRGGSRDL